MLLMLLLIDPLLLLLISSIWNYDKLIDATLLIGSVVVVVVVVVIIVDDPDHRFRCCSFPAAAVISLSFIADADADAADRFTTVVAAIAAINPAEHENYDKSIDEFFAPAIDWIVAADNLELK